MDYKEYCKGEYDYCFRELYQKFLNGRNSLAAQADSERKAQREAMLYAFQRTLEEYSNTANAADIWNALYRAHLLRKVDISNLDDLNETVVDEIISGSQSWKKSSGHVFEKYVVVSTEERLKNYNIRFVLQKTLTQMLHDGSIHNDTADDIAKIAKSDDFDIYAIVDVNGNNIVYGCIQAKTSIRDRVGRDRDFSIPIMEKHFWSAAVVLDGTYLAMPKFQCMVNGGGTTQYEENGWHGMYVMSNAQNNDRIYYDKNLDLLIEDAKQAADKFTSARQRFNRYWQALHV